MAVEYKRRDEDKFMGNPCVMVPYIDCMFIG